MWAVLGAISCTARHGVVWVYTARQATVRVFLRGSCRCDCLPAARNTATGGGGGADAAERVVKNEVGLYCTAGERSGRLKIQERNGLLLYKNDNTKLWVFHAPIRLREAERSSLLKSQLSEFECSEHAPEIDRDPDIHAS